MGTVEVHYNEHRVYRCIHPKSILIWVNWSISEWADNNSAIFFIYTKIYTLKIFRKLYFLFVGIYIEINIYYNIVKKY